MSRLRKRLMMLKRPGKLKEKAAAEKAEAEKTKSQLYRKIDKVEAPLTQFRGRDRAR
jgi:hypothetical protein